MTKFKPVQNEVTGRVDYNFTGMLRSVGTKVFENVNGTKYVLGTLDFDYPNGKPAVGVTTQIFEKSLVQGIKPGQLLLSTLSQDEEGKLWLRTSHLEAGNNIDTDAFGSLFGVAEPVAATTDATAGIGATA